MNCSTTIDVEAEDVESSERKDACDCCRRKVFCMGREQEGSRCDRRIPVNGGVHSPRAGHRRRLGGAGTGSALFTRLADCVYGPLIGLVAVDANIATAASTSTTLRRTAHCWWSRSLVDSSAHTSSLLATPGSSESRASGYWASCYASHCVFGWARARMTRQINTIATISHCNRLESLAYVRST